jgi:hypothetical protein
VRRIGGRAGSVLAVAALAGSACYSYVPVDAAAPPPGEDVRLFVTQQGAAEFSEVAPVDGPIPDLRGRVVGREGSDLLLAVEVTSRQVGLRAIGLEQTVRIPIGEILSIERRVLNKPSTVAVVVGLVAGGTAMLLGIIDAFGGPPGAEPDHDFLINLFSIPVG